MKRGAGANLLVTFGQCQKRRAFGRNWAVANASAHSTALTLALSRAAGEGTDLRFARSKNWIPGYAENDGGGAQSAGANQAGWN